MTFLKRLRVVGLLAALVVLLIPSSLFPVSTSSANSVSEGKVRIGYFANITHAPALIARQLNLFEKNLGAINVEYNLFSVGTAAIEALKGGAIDIAYLGPGPAISGYTTTEQTLLKIISGVTSGGAKFVVHSNLIAKPGAPTRAEINALKGHLFATPGIGGTQDVALRNYLQDNGLSIGSGAGKVSIAPSDNPTTLNLFQKGDLDGAWVPEPWATRLQVEGDGSIFIDEAALWPAGQFATTNLVASQRFLTEHPALVRQILLANNEALAFLNNPNNLATAKTLVQKEIVTRTGKSLSKPTLDGAWESLKFGTDPVATSLRQNFINGVKVGVLRGSVSAKELDGIYDLRILNKLQAPATVVTLSTAGLGKK